MIQKNIGWAFLIYGIALMLLGWVGGQSGSRISLYAGVATGVLVVVGSLLLLIKHPQGRKFCCGLSGFLTLLFFVRYLLSHKTLPAGLAITSAAFLLVFLISLIPAKK